MKTNKYINLLSCLALIITSISMTGCKDEPDKFKLTGGTPTINYIRTGGLASSDSLITEAVMESLIVLVGENLTSIREMYFNDQKAVLNTSFITDHTLFVNIPKEIPEKVSDKIYMITADGDTTKYDFHVIVPAPTVLSMSNEWAKPGETVTINGDYFIDDPNVPLEVKFNEGKLNAEITNFTKTTITAVVPEGAKAGNVYVESIYGSTKGGFKYLDTRNILFDRDGSHGGHASGYGWRSGKIYNEDGIDGAYLRLSGPELSGEIGATWAEDDYSFNYWPDPANGFEELSSRTEFANYLKTYGVAKLQMKFEVRIPSANPWSSCALQLIFSGNGDVTSATASNGYFSNATLPRGLWLPWSTSGTYDTGGKWVTVSIPLSSFNKNHEGTTLESPISADRMTGLAFFVWNGGVAGTNCTPVIEIDNIRVVPIE